MRNEFAKLLTLFLMCITILNPVQVFAKDTYLNSVPYTLINNNEFNNSIKEIGTWIDPFTDETEEITNRSADESNINSNIQGINFWIDPFTGEVTARNNNSSRISQPLTVDTTWRTYAVGAMPLLALNTQIYAGVYSSTNGPVQMRVVRSRFDNPLFFHATARSINEGTGFIFNVPRGDIWELQARVTSGTSTVRFE